MASNSVKRLRDADHIVFLENATIGAEGNYRDFGKAIRTISIVGPTQHVDTTRTYAIAQESEQTEPFMPHEDRATFDLTKDIDEEARATASGVVSAVRVFLSCSGWLNVTMISLSAFLGR